MKVFAHAAMDCFSLQHILKSLDRISTPIHGEALFAGRSRVLRQASHCLESIPKLELQHLAGRVPR